MGKEKRETPAEKKEDPGSARDRITGLLRDWDFFDAAKEKHPGDGWCILNIDIGHFKLFQAWNGIQKGNTVLRNFGRILREEAEEKGGLAGYQGQDVFMLLMPYEKVRIEALYAKLKAAMEEQTTAGGFLPSIGICMVDREENLQECFNCAAVIAEDAKNSTQERVQLFNSERYGYSGRELSLADDFMHALESGEITFHLQPQCRASTKKIVGAEALTRWRRKDGSYIPPDHFVPVLERYGMITNLDLYIWEKVCAWMRDATDRGLKLVPISINVSRVDIANIDVAAKLQELLAGYRLPAHLLKAEITESAYAENAEFIQQTVKQLRAAGITVLMDDFGRGFSSLNMLRTVNMDVIKLDAGFLRIHETEERRGISILESVISMTQNLSMPIIAEGVESGAQALFLADQGCRYMQGYHFYRPMAPEEFEKLLTDETLIDYRGFRFKFNQQMRVREFLDQNKFTDTMLNNILGPVAFYRQKDQNVDIIRYNQPFYEMVGIEPEVLAERQMHIQQFFYQDDVPRFFQLLEKAAQDRVNGADGEFRIYRPNGVLIWLFIRVYFQGNTEQGRIFYASLRDITDKQYLNLGLPGAYYRCTDDETYELLYISENFLDMTGFSREELTEQFGNRLARMIHPNDLEGIRLCLQQVREGKPARITPYRIRTKAGGYIYVAEQAILTDQFGRPCWQAVLIDVTDTILVKNRMEMLNRISHFSVAFVREKCGRRVFETVLHGQEGRLKSTAAELDDLLNGGRVFSAESGEELGKLLEERQDALESLNGRYTIRTQAGETVPTYIYFDRIRDNIQAECVLTICA